MAISDGFELHWVTGRSIDPGPPEQIPVRSAAELDDLLSRLTREGAACGPFVAELVSPSGASLAIGLGREEAILAFKTGATSPPYYVSRGNRAPVNGEDGTVAYDYQGHWTEFGIEALVPMERARRAMCEFLVTKTLPQEVDWTEV